MVGFCVALAVLRNSQQPFDLASRGVSNVTIHRILEDSVQSSTTGYLGGDLPITVNGSPADTVSQFQKSLD